jgi:hypothetical protein
MYLLVENFNQGLDTRRMFLTSKAGSLQVLKNAHITRGGEIEKRKAFANFASLPAGTFGLQAAADQLYTFGSQNLAASMPSGVNYLRLQHPDGVSPMTSLVYSETFNGKVYAVAQFGDANNSVYHFYDPSINNVASGAVTISASATTGSISQITINGVNLLSGAVTGTATTAATATAVAAAISAYTATSKFSASVNNSNTSQITITAPTGTGSTYAGKSITVTTAGTGLTVGTSVMAGGPRITAWDVIAPSVGNNNQIASSLAFLISKDSNFNATVSGNVVTIKAITANQAFTLTGSTNNGGSLNDQSITFATVTAAGSGASSAAQISTATISGTFQVGDTFTITAAISATNYQNTFTASAKVTSSAKAIRTYSSKMYSVVGSLLYFSDILDPTKYTYLNNPSFNNGSGFIDLSNQDNGFETLQGIGVYLGKLAVLARRAVQIWTLDPDPTKNVFTQILKNIGTFAPKSVANFGDIDVFFLSDTGVRSLRARDASNAATVSDVGTNIDTLVQADISALDAVDPTIKTKAVGIIEPQDGRYWLAVGPKIYVYSYFPTPGIAAWSTYEPGWTASALTYANNQVYARTENADGTATVYLYGGANNQTYDNSQVEVIFPYLDAGKPAHIKTLQAIDLTCLGTWNIYIGCDTTVPSVRDYCDTVFKSTFDISRIQASGMGSHIGVRLTSDTSGEQIQNVAFSYSGTTITASSPDHGLIVGETFTISGQTGSNSVLNGTWTISAITTNTFTFTVNSAPSAALSPTSIYYYGPAKIGNFAVHFDINDAG